MEKRQVEKKCGKEWVNINVSDLVEGDEFRTGEERSYIVEGVPFMDNGEWKVEVQDA